MKKCSNEHCEQDAEYIDIFDNYSCTECMDDDLENGHTA
jgi:hypothetical protein